MDETGGNWRMGRCDDAIGDDRAVRGVERTIATDGRPVPLPDRRRGPSQLARLAREARSHKVRIIGATLLPFAGALVGTPFEGHFSQQKERLRQLVNHWIRTSGSFDRVVDFDALLRDPDQPSRIRPRYASGDRLHPGDAGYNAMANAFDLEILFGK
jgi:hypothetical protein